MSTRQTIQLGLSISELERTSTNIQACGWMVTYWRNGTYLVESPTGEKTEVPEDALAGVLSQLFQGFF